MCLCPVTRASVKKNKKKKTKTKRQNRRWWGATRSGAGAAMLMMGAAEERCDSGKQRRGRGTGTGEEMEGGGGGGGGPSVARLWRVPNAWIPLAAHWTVWWPAAETETLPWCSNKTCRFYNVQLKRSTRLYFKMRSAFTILRQYHIRGAPVFNE